MGVEEGGVGGWDDERGVGGGEGEVGSHLGDEVEGEGEGVEDGGDERGGAAEGVGEEEGVAEEDVVAVVADDEAAAEGGIGDHGEGVWWVMEGMQWKKMRKMDARRNQS